MVVGRGEFSMFLLHHLDQKLNVGLKNLMFSVRYQKRDELHQQESAQASVQTVWVTYNSYVQCTCKRSERKHSPVPPHKREKKRWFLSLLECGTKSQKNGRSYSQKEQNVAAHAGMKEMWRRCGCANPRADDDMKNQVRRRTTQQTLAWMHDNQGKETRQPLLTQL